METAMDDPADEKPKLARAQLHRMLVRAAQVSAWASMAAWLPWMVLVGAFVPYMNPILGTALLFGGGLLISWRLERLIVPHMAKCPACGCCLWKLGTENFKARRLKLRPEATACPGCGMPILP